jgi:hypothetical protein
LWLSLRLSLLGWRGRDRYRRSAWPSLDGGRCLRRGLAACDGDRAARDDADGDSSGASTNEKVAARSKGPESLT